MAQDLLTQFYTCLNLPLQEKIVGLTRIIDQSGPHKDLQVLFLHLINNIFSTNGNNGWDLRHITFESYRYDFEALMSFLEPQGPMFRLCYKLLHDPQLKFNLPLNALPLEMQMTLERGRCPQFYADMLAMDSQSLNLVGLSLNPFDYYIFNFALHLINNNPSKGSWENWNSVYFMLACDYLMHFLPSDPNVPVLPHIPYYTGKVPTVPPLQSASRPLYSPSLLLLPDLSGINNQHSSPQSQSRNEIWRSETVLQVLVDIWMSVEQYNNRSINMYQTSLPAVNSSPERVRIVRVLVKHIHSFSAKYHSDPAVRSSALRKYARQIMCSRAYHYTKQLVMTWPLDASFRLVMELWLSLIQPWRYTNNTTTLERHSSSQVHHDEAGAGVLDASFIQFIAENFPTYTCILQLVLSRFLRLDLTAYKNAVMLFRLGKVFSQPNLVPILHNLEKGITGDVSGVMTPDTSYNNLNVDQSYTYNGIPLHKWVGIAKQAISELNMCTTFEYRPVWGDNNRGLALEFVKRIVAAKLSAVKYREEYTVRLSEDQHGFLNLIKNWLMLGHSQEEEVQLEELKKVPAYLGSCINYYSNLFALSDSSVLPMESELVDSSLEHSTFSNSNNFTLNITQKLRDKPGSLQYMGDPDLMPIMTYENTILVRILYQLSSKLNELYGDEFSKMWNRQDFLGYIAREILQRPSTAHTYERDLSGHARAVQRTLPPRLSLRRLGGNAVLAWLLVGYCLGRMFNCGAFFYIFCLLFLWTLLILSKAAFKAVGLIND